MTDRDTEIRIVIRKVTVYEVDDGSRKWRGDTPMEALERLTKSWRLTGQNCQDCGEKIGKDDPHRYLKGKLFCKGCYEQALVRGEFPEAEERTAAAGPFDATGTGNCFIDPEVEPKKDEEKSGEEPEDDEPDEEEPRTLDKKLLSVIADHPGIDKDELYERVEESGHACRFALIRLAKRGLVTKSGRTGSYKYYAKDMPEPQPEDWKKVLEHVKGSIKDLGTCILDWDEGLRKDWFPTFEAFKRFTMLMLQGKFPEEQLGGPYRAERRRGGSVLHIVRREG